MSILRRAIVLAIRNVAVRPKFLGVAGTYLKLKLEEEGYVQPHCIPEDVYLSVANEVVRELASKEPERKAQWGAVFTELDKVAGLLLTADSENRAQANPPLVRCLQFHRLL